MEIAAKDKEFYLQAWNSKPHRCFESNVALGIDSFHAHHVLPKETYDEYRYELWNIVLISPTVHDQTHIDIEKTPKIHALYLELLEKHNTFE